MNNFESVDTYLEHFGKKGMRWGVRTQTNSKLNTKQSITVKKIAKKTIKSNSRPVRLIKKLSKKIIKNAIINIGSKFISSRRGQAALKSKMKRKIL